METAHRHLLMKVARTALERAVHDNQRMTPDPAAYPPGLREPRACFVTLKKKGQLRGCIGSLNARRPLVEEVATMAYASALEDPRFSPVKPEELSDISLEISALSEPIPFPVSSEQDLIAQVRPGVDGLILEEGRHRATFLPSVWDELPHPRDFLRHLKLKAGLPEDYWSETLTFQRYTVELIHGA